MPQCEVILNTPECKQDQAGRTKCFACGNSVCVGCSAIVKRYLQHLRVRICRDCMEDRWDDIEER